MIGCEFILPYVLEILRSAMSGQSGRRALPDPPALWICAFTDREPVMQWLLGIGFRLLLRGPFQAPAMMPTILMS